MRASEPGRVARQIRVQGLVQGVGFRPFIYQLAIQLHLTGYVFNDDQGVLVHLEGALTTINTFLDRLFKEHPKGVQISSSRTREIAPEQHEQFCIRESPPRSGPTSVRVPPDRVICPDCLDDIFSPGNRRYQYPLTTCTNCGPRFSIIQSMPYDRHRTTMSVFPPCSDCSREYADPLDRRFHAQPIACPRCGPATWLGTTKDAEAIAQAAAHLRAGEIIALKGIGGFQLLVRADSKDGIARLRQRKARPTKPFAVMMSSLAQVCEHVELSPCESDLLQGSAGPILLARRRPQSTLAENIAPGLNQIGVMLPTSPLHHLLMQHLDFPIVATSGNGRDEPIEIEETAAERSLGEITTLFLVHDRPVARRVDDSVVRVIADRPVLIRLARGYAPLALPHLETWIRRQSVPPPPILAVGGQQKNALALWTGEQAILGPHIGDLDHPRTRQAFLEQMTALPELYGCKIQQLACDLHPDYTSTRLAESTGLPSVHVQHHHAHAVACMVEHQLLDKEVLAFSWDGTGHGKDGMIWGSEVLLATTHKYARMDHLRPFPLPGGEAAIREPRRIALAMLLDTFSPGETRSDIPLLNYLGYTQAQAGLIQSLIERGLNTPLTTSMGRLFDAAAVLILGVHQVSYEGEAAARLEAITDHKVVGYYSIIPTIINGKQMGDWRPLMRALEQDRRDGVSAEVMSTRFHRGIARWLVQVAERYPTLPIVLGGGCFINQFLVEEVQSWASDAGRQLYPASQIPPGDGGLAAGQLAVALAHSCRH